MHSSTTNRYVRRAAMAVGTTLVGSMALVGPAATPAQAVDLPSCTITLDGIPQVGQTLHTTLTVNAAGIALNLPIASVIVALDPVTGLPTGTPLDSVTGQLGGALGSASLPLSVANLGQQFQAVATAIPALPGLPIDLLTCKSVPSGPVVSPPGAGGGGSSTTSTTLGATPVSSAPRIVGKTKVRKTVRADVGAVGAGTTVSYQWFKKKNKRAPRAIAGATGASYKIKKAIRGKRLYVVVTYAKAGYTPSVVGSQSRRVR